MSEHTSKSVRPDLLRFWPYLLFTIIVVIYNLLYLRYGFNATDEGYLLSLGQRIADGDHPFINFYFLRTPLSIYIQALFIEIFGDSYTVMASRFFWAVQMWAMALVTSILYRKYVKPPELFLMLLGTYVVSSLLIAFPWYNYDAAFFAALTIVLFSKGQYVLSGGAAFFAAMSKQNYIAFLPLFWGAGFLLRYFRIEVKDLNLRSALKMFAGFATPSLAYITYLLVTGGFEEFIRNVFILPRTCSEETMWFAIFQNNPKGFLYALPLILTTGFLFYFDKGRWRYFLAACALIAVVLMFYEIDYYVFSLLFLNYAVFILVLWQTRRGDEKVKQQAATKLFSTYLFAMVVQYLSGFSYSGIITAYVGAAIALPLSYIIFRELSPSSYRVVCAIWLFVGILAIGSFHKYHFIYRDDVRSNLTAEFKTGKLKGVRTTPRNFQQITDLTAATEYYSKKGEYVLIYPDFPIFYYLTDRRNPTKIEWYYRFEFNLSMLPEAKGWLEKNRPKVIFVQKYAEADYLRKGSTHDYMAQTRYSPLFHFFALNYEMKDPVGDIFIFLPKTK